MKTSFQVLGSYILGFKANVSSSYIPKYGYGKKVLSSKKFQLLSSELDKVIKLSCSQFLKPLGKKEKNIYKQNLKLFSCLFSGHFEHLG
jgi:hypothetical protein